MKMKKGLALLLALICLLSFPLNVAEARTPERNIKVWINDFYVMSDVHPFVENGRTYVPVRFIAEELGYKVDWNGEKELVTISKGEDSIYLYIDSQEVYMNEDTYELDAPARLRKARTFVPFRAVAELFGEEVEYDGENKIAIIGDEFNPEEYYPLKYYLENNDPFITNSKANFIDYIVRYSDGRLFQLKSDQEIFKLIDEEGKNFKEVEFEIEVEEDKQLHDKHYIAPIKEDPFVGTWYGQGIVEKGSTTYFDRYYYIEKSSHNNYNVIRRQIKPNGSEFIVKASGYYDEYANSFVVSKIIKILKATGDYNYNWIWNGGKLKIKDFDYMYSEDDTNTFLRKY